MRALAFVVVPVVLLGCETPPPARPAPLASPKPSVARTQGSDEPRPIAKADPGLPPRRLFFSNPDRTGVKLSPDGKRVSFLSSKNGVSNVFVAPADAPEKAEPVTNDTKRGIRSYTWAFTNEHLLYRQDEGGDENYHVHVVDLRTKVDRDVTPLPRVQARIEARSRKHPREVIVAMNDRDPRYHDAFVIDVVTGQKKLVLKNDLEMSAFVYDDELNPRVALKTLPDGGTQYFEHDPKGKGEKAFLPFAKVGLEDTLTTSPLAFDAKGTTLYLTDSRGRDTAALVAFDLVKKTARVLVDDGQADIEGATFDPKTLVPQAAQASYEKSRWHLVDQTLTPDFEILRELAKGDTFDVVSRSQDDTRWLVLVTSSDGPNRYYRYERPKDKKGKHEAHFLFSSHVALEDKKLAPMHPRALRSRDGLSLVSYLTLPPGSDPDGDGKPDKPVPMVLLVHGGPWSRDVYGFSPHAQWLSSRGYAVLSVNFRGSTGFGKSFINGADRQWGAKMHDDLVDAVAWAEAEKITSPGKTAIMGGSYGGYATLVGLTFTPEKFACGVDIVGPSNLATLLETIPPYWASELEQFTKRIGDHRTTEGKAFLATRSPLTFASRIRRPLLIGQGKNDPRVKQSESDQITAAMRSAGQKVTYVLYPDEGHGFARPENRLSFNAVAEAFLAQCLGGSYEPVGEDFKGSSIEVVSGKSEVVGLAAALP